MIEYLDKIINNLIISYNIESFTQEQITTATSTTTYKKSNKFLKI